MEHEFIDDMFERLLIKEKRTFGETFKIIIKERATHIVDLGRIENAYKLFCKKYKDALPYYFRLYVKDTRREDFNKCVRCFGWQDPIIEAKNGK